MAATRSDCLYCGAPLLPDPQNPHWAHCPNCNPTHYQAALSAYKRGRAEQYASWAVSDTRGRPTRGGVKV